MRINIQKELQAIQIVNRVAPQLDVMLGSNRVITKDHIKRAVVADCKNAGIRDARMVDYVTSSLAGSYAA